MAHHVFGDVRAERLSQRLLGEIRRGLDARPFQPVGEAPAGHSVHVVLAERSYQEGHRLAVGREHGNAPRMILAEGVAVEDEADPVVIAERQGGDRLLLPIGQTRDEAHVAAAQDSGRDRENDGRGADLALGRRQANVPARPVDPRHRGVEVDRQAGSQARDQVAIALLERPVLARIPVTGEIDRGDLIGIGRVVQRDPVIEQRRPLVAAFGHFRHRNVAAGRGRLAQVSVAAREEGVAIAILRLARPAVRDVQGAVESALAVGESGPIGHFDKGVEARRVHPVAAQVEINPGRDLLRIAAPAEPVRSLQDDEAHALISQPAASAQTGGPGADHGDIHG